jgi:hypothetical protein
MFHTSLTVEEELHNTDLRDSPMMAHLLDALERGEDIGPFGRLVFTMVARYFLEDEEIIELLSLQPGMGMLEAQAQLFQIKEHDYSPPDRERIMEWQEYQDFPICPDPEDPEAFDVYRQLRFPDEVEERMEMYREERIADHVL